MESGLLFGVSLTASFLAGVLALFAPCCITFLFPSYLGTIFKESSKVMYFTLLFALGLASILIPIALGFRFFVFFFDQYHTQLYYLGGLFLILMGIFTLKPLFHFPQLFQVQPHIGKKITSSSALGLGVMSGLTSSCCAPVLFAAVTLTSLTPTLVQALFVSFAYVLGIVFPLFLLSMFHQKLTGRLSGKNRQKMYQILQIAGAGIFILSGFVIIVLNALNKIQMYQMEGYSRSMRLFIYGLAKYTQTPLVDIAIFAFLVFIFYKLLKKHS